MGQLRKVIKNSLPPGHQGAKLDKVLNINLKNLVYPLCLCALVAGEDIPEWAQI